jgi:heme oxygenase
MKTESTAQQLFHKLKYCWQPTQKREARSQPLTTVVRDVVKSVDNTPRSTQAMKAQNRLLSFVRAAELAQQDAAPALSDDSRKQAFKDMRVLQKGLAVERDKAGLDRGQVGSSNHTRYEELRELAQQARTAKHQLKT